MTTIRAPGGTTPGTRLPWRRQRRQGSLVPYMAPAVAVLVAIGLLPLLSTINLSFRTFSYILPGQNGEWVGLGNYQALLGDASFWGAVARTVVFTLSAVFLELVAGLLLAAALNVTTSGRRLLVSLLIIPMILTPVIIGLMFNFALNPLFGPLATIIDGLGITQAEDILGTPLGAFVSLVLVDVWQWTPFMALILWAGMQALPVPPQEAAAVDGASFLQRLRLVMLPMLRPVVVVAVISAPARRSASSTRCSCSRAAARGRPPRCWTCSRIAPRSSTGTWGWALRWGSRCSWPRWPRRSCSSGS